MNIFKKLDKLSLPVTIIIASVILGGFYYTTQINKQNSIERQQQIKIAETLKLQSREYEIKKKELIDKRKKECYIIFNSERKAYKTNEYNINYNISYDYYPIANICRIYYSSPISSDDYFKEAWCYSNERKNSEVKWKNFLLKEMGKSEINFTDEEREKFKRSLDEFKKCRDGYYYNDF